MSGDVEIGGIKYSAQELLEQIQHHNEIFKEILNTIDEIPLLARTPILEDIKNIIHRSLDRS